MKRIISMIIAVVMVLAVMPVSVFAVSEIASGTCGDNLTWVLTDDGTLTISGTGEMSDWYSSPWNSYRSSIETVVIENGITSIGEHAFSGCSNLASISIPNSVTSIGTYSFSSCNNLFKVYITDLTAWCNISFESTSANPFSQNLLGGRLYLNGDLITDLVIPEGVEKINACSFYGCESIESATIPYGVTTIDEYAFSDCINLSSIYISNSVTSIGNSAFSDCTSLSYINIPDSVINIGDYAFQYCPSINSVSIPNSVTSIGDYVFRNCSGLTYIDIPDSVTDIGVSAFEDCSMLTYINIPNSVTRIGDRAFETCSSLSSISIPAGVTSIDSWTFYGCSNLLNITFESPDTMIYDWGYTISSTATIYGHEGSIAQAYAEKYNRKFNVIGETSHECSFGAWAVYGWQTHIRHCTEEGCTAFEKNAHVFSSETDLSCNVCGYGDAEPDFTGDGSVDKNDAIYLLYHVLFGAEAYPLN